jgi:uncharacterized GH25 family protein
MFRAMRSPLSPCRRVVSIVLAALVGIPVSLSAHDMWLEPTTFTPDAGRIIAVRLRVGQDMLGDPLPRDSGLIDQFVVLDASGTRPVVGRDGADPAGLLQVPKPDLAIVGYSTHPSPIVLEAEKFNAYLTEEGLEPIAALRAQRNQTNAPAREAFARCAKSLILSGTATSQQTDRVLGFTLELVSERNPYLTHPGDELPVRLLYKGRPLAGALVVAMNRLNPMEKIKVRTDATGHARLRLNQPGMWLVKAVHMVSAPPGLDAEWASYWASLTFMVSGAASESATR